MALQDVLDKFTPEENNPAGLNASTTAVLTRLYNSGGPEIREMLDSIAADDSRKYQIQDILWEDILAGTMEGAGAGIGLDNITAELTFSVGMNYEWIMTCH